jgi:pimeloyl-ACP methyl ester carboxylesterase
MIEAMRITLGDLSFDALAAGPEGDKPILLLHGWPEFADCWRPIMQALAGSGYRAVAVDQRGYSPGARPLDVTDYAMDRLVADALGFADQLGWTTFHLVAHDWGGMVAWTLAGAHPDRLRSLSVLATPHPVALSTESATDEAQYHRLDYIRFFRHRAALRRPRCSPTARRGCAPPMAAASRPPWWMLISNACPGPAR